MATIAEKLFNFILEDRAAHEAILRSLPPDKVEAVMGRKGRITISGPQGGVFIMRLTRHGLFREPDADDIRNEVRMTDDTLIAIAVYLADLPDKPGISPRDAYTNGFIEFDGESVLYDAEEIFTALEQHGFAKMKPIAREAVMAMEQK